MSHSVQLEDRIQDGQVTAKAAKIGLALALVGLGGAAALGSAEGDHWRLFFHAYLAAFSWALAICIGGLMFVIIQHLVNAHWSVTVRRIAEYTTNAMPWMGVLALPFLYPILTHHGAEEFGGLLWPWLHPHGDHQALIEHKSAWLNRDFFLIRLVAYFVLWSAIAKYFLKRSLEQDVAPEGDYAPTMRAKKMSAPMVIVMALTLSFAAFDLLMSLAPEWFSTIFGVYFFAGGFRSIMAWIIICALFLRRNRVADRSIHVEHYHDLGKFMFAFIIFWAYIAFSQFMLIWYANIPEETGWFGIRRTEAWMPATWFLVLGNFFIPFLGVISRHVKRNTKLLGFWACYMLFIEWVDMTWLVMPQLDHGATFSVGIINILALVGVAGFLIFAVARAAGNRPLVPLRDPLLAQSLAFKNS